MANGASVLVFGGTGLLGAPLALRLAERGHRVHVAARSKQFAASTSICSVRCDVSQGEVADGLLREIDPSWVINCAAVTSVDACESGGLAERVNADWPRERASLMAAFDSNWIAPLGPEVDAFERELAIRTGVSAAAALSSGTAALHLALILLDVEPGDEVWTSTLTFAATANAIRYVDATPVFIDSERAS